MKIEEGTYILLDGEVHAWYSPVSKEGSIRTVASDKAMALAKDNPGREIRVLSVNTVMTVTRNDK